MIKIYIVYIYIYYIYNIYIYIYICWKTNLFKEVFKKAEIMRQSLRGVVQITVLKILALLKEKQLQRNLFLTPLQVLFWICAKHFRTDVL